MAPGFMRADSWRIHYEHILKSQKSSRRMCWHSSTAQTLFAIPCITYNRSRTTTAHLLCIIGPVRQALFIKRSQYPFSMGGVHAQMRLLTRQNAPGKDGYLIKMG